MATRILICDDNSPIRRMATRRPEQATIAVSPHDVGDQRPNSPVGMLLADLDVTTELVDSEPTESARIKQ